MAEPSVPSAAERRSAEVGPGSVLICGSANPSFRCSATAGPGDSAAPPRSIGAGLGRVRSGYSHLLGAIRGPPGAPPADAWDRGPTSPTGGAREKGGTTD